MSPICSEEPPSVSPPLPPRLHHPAPATPSSLPSSLASALPVSAGSGPPPAPGDPPQPGQPQFPGLDPSNLAALTGGYPRLGAGGMMGLGAAMPGLPYSSSEQNPYSSISMENFYSPLVSSKLTSPPLLLTPSSLQANPYTSIKEAGSGPELPSWPSAGSTAAGLAATAGYYPYDTSALSAYGYGGAYGLAGTRKNVTRESTATLKAWLNEHKKNPYPTKGEKIMLAIISKMTLTQVITTTHSKLGPVFTHILDIQVSCWFANARRRLKKENKMTWEPKNGLHDEDVDVSEEEEDGDNSFTKDEKPNALGECLPPSPPPTRHRAKCSRA